MELRMLFSLLISVCLIPTRTEGFTTGGVGLTPKPTLISNQFKKLSSQRSPQKPPAYPSNNVQSLSTTTATDSTRLMSNNSDSGPGLLTTLGVVAILVGFIGTSIAPMLNAPGFSDISLGDSVVTRGTTSKIENYQSKGDALSRTKIQEKLNRLPVFYLLDAGSNTMGKNIYLSFNDAVAASKESADYKLKCTTLDQVMYPLILKRGRMRMAPPPLDIQNAEQALQEETDSDSAARFKLIPSSAVVKDSKERNLGFEEGDVPLFVADRLAFAGSDGPQVPLFLDRSDCMISYDRLLQSKKSLTSEPVIRTTTLKDVLDSMERGTRPAVSQLQFYGTEDDLLHASEII